MIFMGRYGTRNSEIQKFENYLIIFCFVPQLCYYAPLLIAFFFPPFRKSNFDSCGSHRRNRHRGPSARPLPGKGGIPSPPVRCWWQAWTCSRLQ